MASVFDGIFREYVFTYYVQVPVYAGGSGGESESEGEGGGGGLGERMRDPATGNYLFESVPHTVKAYAKTPNLQRAKEIRDVYGVDDKSFPLTGRLIDPVLMPDALRTGDVVDAVMDGVPGKLRIVRGLPSPLEIIDELLGQPFDGVWTPQP